MPLPNQVEPQRRLQGRFTILAVCTGNLCRSPQVGALLRARLPEALGTAASGCVQVASAGSHAVDGARMDPLAAAEADLLGLTSMAGHRARRLSTALVQRADLVLGLERAHRRAAVELDPSANRRAFTLTEFTTVLGALDPGELAITGSGNDIRQHLALVVSAAARSRGVVATSRDIAYDIEDPYRREPEAYRRSARAIEETVGAMVARLAALVRTS